MKWRVFLILCFLIDCLSTPAQQLTHRPVQNYSVNDGLSQSSVWAVAEDQQGVLWIATADGLNRFDGSAFTVFKPSHHLEKRTGNNLSVLYTALSGDLWTSSGRYLIKLNPITYSFHFYKIPDAITGQLSPYWKVVKLHEVETNKFLVATYDGLFSFDESGDEWGVVTGELKGISDMEVDKQGVYLACYKGFFRYTFATGAITEIASPRGSPMHDCRAVLKRPDGSVVVGGNGFLKCFFPEEDVWKDLEVTAGGGAFVNDLLLLPDSSFAAVTLSRGVHVFDRLLNRRTQLLKGDLSYHSVVGFLTSGNDLVVGYDGGGIGIMHLNPSSFNSITTNEGLPANMIKGMFVDGEERLWVGTGGYGLAVVDFKRDEIATILPQGLTSEEILPNSVLDFSSSPDSAIWIATGSHIFKHLRGKSEAKKLMIEKLPILKADGKETNWRTQSHNIITLPNSNILSATNNHLWEIDSKTGKIISLSTISSEANNPIPVISDFVLLNEDTVLIGTTGGLMLYSTHNHQLVRDSPHSAAFEAISANSLLLQRDTLWAGGPYGLFRYAFQSRNLVHFGVPNGLANDFIYGILPDNGNRLWLSTNNGISCFFQGTETFVNFTHKDGLLSNEFNTNAFAKAPDGMLFFGGVEGVNYFNPEEVLNKIVQTKVFVSDFLVGNKPYSGDTAIQFKRRVDLPYSSNSFSIELSAQLYGKGPRPEIGLLIEGLDEAVTGIEENTPVRYSNLAPGVYTIKAAVKDSEGKWQVQYQLLQLNILPPFWKTLWFYFLVAAIALAGVLFAGWLVLRRKVALAKRELERRLSLQKERERISRDMHDDLGAGLTQISIWSEVIQATTSREEEEAYLTKISAMARSLVTNLNEIIWALKLHPTDTDHFFAYIREFVGDFFDHTSVGCAISISPQSSFELSQIAMRNIFLIVKEASHNILKHSRATEAVYRIEVADNALQILIKDNGIGFKPGEKGGNGLKNMVKRAREIDALLDIGTPAKGGCQLKLTLAIKKSHERVMPTNT